MRLGFFTMPMHPPGSDPAETLRDDLEQIVTADKLGYKEAWIGEHLTAEWENIPAPDLLIAQALPLTENIILGTGVNCLTNHDPFMLAHRIAQLDNMARGRFYWGIGSGVFAGDLEAYGYDPKSKENRQASREILDVIIDLWNDPKPGLYESKYFKFRVPDPDPRVGLGVHMKPFQKPHPPIGVAGLTPYSSTLVVAGERGWIPMSSDIIPPRIIETHWSAVESGASNGGPAPNRSEWRIARDIFVADTTEEARKLALEGTLGRDYRDYFLRLGRRARGLEIFKQDPDTPDSAIDLEYVMEHIWVVGSPDDVVEKLSGLYEAVGGFGVLLAVGHEWKPHDKWLHSMTLLAEEVMPRLAHLK